MLDSPNWKLTADGYVDGYHIGYLHSSTIGEKSITNRNTYDFFGPHVRIGFANKPINEIRDRPESEWPPMFEVMSMVHYVFPNVSISGQPGAAADGQPAAARAHAGPLAHGAVPLLPPAGRGRRGRRRWPRPAARSTPQVTGDEDFVTGFKINRGLGAIADGHFRFGRNEGGNQNLHRWIDELVTNGRGPST